ncbi:hypothetical protein F8388_000672 [Cannabis sativa]|uniref:Uncharacterized protein n=1 Tax=Cannabis sativa TaxID=3483 RepID=A0A7J6HBU8_CANSA|nr:hypothetical protein F8388_000672 [Cannabis sativa]
MEDALRESKPYTDRLFSRARRAINWVKHRWEVSFATPVAIQEQSLQSLYKRFIFQKPINRHDKNLDKS